MNHASLSAVANHFDWIRETQGPNRGYMVEFLQAFGGGQPGESWCMYFVWFVLCIAYKMRPPVTVVGPKGSTQAFLTACRAKGFIVAEPEVDDLVFHLNAAGLAHHVGIITATMPLTSIAGNTSADGLSTNGDGTHEHLLLTPRLRLVFARLR